MKLNEKGAKKNGKKYVMQIQKETKRQSNKYEIETTFSPCCRLRTIKDEKDQLHPGVLEK